MTTLNNKKLKKLLKSKSRVKIEQNPDMFYKEFLKSEEVTVNGKSYEEKALISDDLSATAYKVNFDIFVYEDKIFYKLDYNSQLYDGKRFCKKTSQW